MKELRLANKDLIVTTLNELGIKCAIEFGVERSIKYEYLVGSGSVDGVQIYVKCEPTSLRKSYCEVENPEFRYQGALKIVEPEQLKSAILEVVAIAKQLKQKHSELVALVKTLREKGFSITTFSNHVEVFKNYGGSSYIRVYMDASGTVSIIFQVLNVAPQQAVELAKKLDKAIAETLSTTTK